MGRINDPVFAEKILAEGKADMIGICRGQIADPEFVNKAKAGKLDDIRPCSVSFATSEPSFSSC